VSFNKVAITEVVPPDHEQGLIMDASFVPKSGKHTYGLDRFWNGSHSRTERGLEISTLAWLDLTGNCCGPQKLDLHAVKGFPRLRPHGFMAHTTHWTLALEVETI
jgi:hypothetical protein